MNEIIQKDRPVALLWGILASRGREQTYSLLNPGPPLAKALFLNSVQTFCNCEDWGKNEEKNPENLFILLITYVFNELRTKVTISISYYFYWVFSWFIQVCMLETKQKQICGEFVFIEL